MTYASRRRVLRSGIFGAACACLGPRLAFATDQPPSGKFVCPPCGCAADGKDFDAPGACPECGMQLMPKPADPKPDATPPASPKGGDDGYSAPGERSC